METPDMQPLPEPFKSVQPYNIDNHRNIIPLNAGFPAFKANFTVRGPTKYKAVVVDQHAIDTANEFDYRESSTTTEGEWFSGEIEYLDSIPRQYYLLLVSDEPVTVQVELHVEPRHPKPQLPPTIPEQPAPVPVEVTKSGTSKWVAIAIILTVVVVISGFLVGIRKKGGGGMPGLPNIDDMLASL